MNQPSSKLLLVLLLLVTAVAFAPALRNGMNGDDHFLLEERVNVMRSSDGLTQLLTHHFWWGTSSTGEKQYVYRPWVTFTYWFEFQIGRGRAWIYHASNVLVHVANTALLYVFLHPVMGMWPSAIVAAFAGLSPTAVSSVGWSTQRTDLWAQFFLLLFLICFRHIRSGDRQRGLWIGASMASYFLALASMEIAISAPILAALFDWVSPPQQARGKRTYSPYLWMIVPIAAWFGLRAAADIPLGTGMLSQRLTHFFQFLPEQYLRTFWNAIFSPHFVYRDDLLWSTHSRGFLFYAGWLLFLGLIVLILFGLKKRRLWAVGGIWFGLMLFPVYAFGQSFAPLSDIYTYAALPGIGLFLVDGIRGLRQRFSSSRTIPRFAPALIIAILAVYGIQSFVRVPLVKDDHTMWTHMARVRPANVEALIRVANFSFESGDAAKGFAWLNKAFAVDSNNADVHVQFVANAIETGNMDFAQPHVKFLEQTGGRNYTAYVWVARYYLEAGNCAKAVELFRWAEQLRVPTPDVLYDYGRALLCINDNASAARAYQSALKQYPAWPEAYNNLGICYENMGQYQQAVMAYKSAVQYNPRLLMGWRSLAAAAAKSGDSLTVQMAVQRFLDLNPSADQKAALQRDLASAGLVWEIPPPQ